MIIKHGLEFHAGELRGVPGINGELLARIPAEIGNTLNERARHVAADSAGTEIRFVTDAPNIRLSLSAIRPEFGFETLDVRIMCGNFEQQIRRLSDGVVTSLMLNPPTNFGGLAPGALRKGPGIGFAPNVWRIIPNRGGFVFCGIETFGHAVRPPEPFEKPAKTCLCYGSSITHSTFDGYPATMGQRLGVDIINLGLSGACQCEGSLADWMATRGDWDVATLELGINMLGQFTPDDFRTRAGHLVAAFVKANPKKPVVLITMFPSSARWAFQKSPGGENRDAAFCEITRQLHAKYAEQGNLHLVEGSEVLDDLNCLSCDILHPRAFGHAVMGLNLAERIRKLI